MRESSGIRIIKKLFQGNSTSGSVLKFEPDEKFCFRNALKPILISLTIIGIQTNVDFNGVGSHRKKLRIRWWNVLALIYLHLFSIKAIVATIMTKGGFGFWMQLTTFLRAGSAALSADIYVFQQVKLEQLIHKIDIIYSKFSREEKRRIKRGIIISVIIIWIFLGINFGSTVIGVYHMGLNKFLDVHLFSVRIQFLPLSVAYVLVGIFMVIRQAMMWGTLSFMVLLYVVFCDGIRRCFKSFTVTLMNTFQQSNPLTAKMVVRLRRQYQHVTGIVLLMDEIFSPAVFLWYSSFILSVCIDITFDVSLHNRIDTLSLFSSVRKLFILFVAYVTIGMSASLVMEESQKCVPAFYKATMSLELWTNAYMLQVVQFLGMHLRTSNVTLTGWKFFILNRTYMLTIVGILVSYVIIVLQLNPRAMEKLIKG